MRSTGGTAISTDEPDRFAGSAEQSTVLVCTADHPRAGDGQARYQGRIHGVRLQQVPFLARPTYREVRGWSDARPGCLVVRCSSSDCRAFSEYEIVGPVRTAHGALLPSRSEPGAPAPDLDGAESALRGAEDRREHRSAPHPEPTRFRAQTPSVPHPQ